MAGHGAHARFVLEGFLVNIEIALIAMVLSLILGLTLALMRLSRARAVSTAAGLWIDLWRNLSQVLVILYLYVNLLLSRLSRRLEIRERRRTGTTVEPVSGVEIRSRRRVHDRICVQTY